VLSVRQVRRKIRDLHADGGTPLIPRQKIDRHAARIVPDDRVHEETLSSVATADFKSDSRNHLVIVHVTPGETREITFEIFGADIGIKREIFGFSLRKERVPFGKSYWIGNEIILQCHFRSPLRKPTDSGAPRLTEKSTV